ncbi:hypothetical protein RhiirA5_499900 [Rhizophagus irregularis]|nr:hypothetical protein GLOIN_2v1493254 [Rhizophagus irregularis DAOM 181602=DAOM 197198]EXX57512.1 hypothetical protein RirG_206470 [Rhizophagus irregularis DAOM 197198w]PKC08520.1 hypothetical protein RhiirA5_499900 [Rhizophagus irregularis]PKC65851.1 hypothetical protein RhiirA1_442033 [Rhizophagus irregularis]POG82727.1 hypothetical protein GLOIN_2v1493254 [Rhizophagus irregularis DAOM 181602=DAOM 197198]|eukprot:XP_025189593.1 hypothetical protein GLOIN_2v1493254 [Rhizophagus irregularis DAOM 181602=DAOM 197198]
MKILGQGSPSTAKLSSRVSSISTPEWLSSETEQSVPPRSISKKSSKVDKEVPSRSVTPSIEEPAVSRPVTPTILPSFRKTRM